MLVAYIACSKIPFHYYEKYKSRFIRFFFLAEQLRVEKKEDILK